MNKELTPEITGLLTELWEDLDDITRSQHILSNSELYQRVRLLQDTVAAFTQLEIEHHTKIRNLQRR
jgi:hypothetical protein